MLDRSRASKKSTTDLVTKCHFDDVRTSTRAAREKQVDPTNVI